MNTNWPLPCARAWKGWTCWQLCTVRAPRHLPTPCSPAARGSLLQPMRYIMAIQSMLTTAPDDLPVVLCECSLAMRIAASARQLDWQTCAKPNRKVVPRPCMTEPACDCQTRRWQDE